MTTHASPGDTRPGDPTTGPTGPDPAAVHDELVTVAHGEEPEPAEHPVEHPHPGLGPDADPVAVLTAERDDYLDSLRRLQADFENYRRRVQRDIDLAVERAIDKLINRLLPVLDNFELALSHEADPDASPLAKVHDTLLSALEAEGLERLWPLDDVFDPATAEAVAHQPDDSGSTVGPIVATVMRAGYRWKGRVIRAAMVGVKG